MPKIWDELHLKRTFNFIIFKSDSHTTWSKKTLKVLNFLVFDIFLKKKRFHAWTMHIHAWQAWNLHNHAWKCMGRQRG